MANKSKLVTVKTPFGYSITVDRVAAPAFIGFLGDLKAAGYQAKDSGSYNYRNIAGSKRLSQHALGRAIDVNSATNPVQYVNSPFFKKRGGMVTDLPKDVSALAAKWGLRWGGDWRNKKDPMHFEYRGAPKTQAVMSKADAKEALAKLGYTGASAIKQFQRAAGITTDGIVGKNTTREIQAALSQSSLSAPSVAAAYDRQQSAPRMSVADSADRMMAAVPAPVIPVQRTALPDLAPSVNSRFADANFAAPENGALASAIPRVTAPVASTPPAPPNRFSDTIFNPTPPASLTPSMVRSAVAPATATRVATSGIGSDATKPGPTFEQQVAASILANKSNADRRLITAGLPQAFGTNPYGAVPMDGSSIATANSPMAGSAPVAQPVVQQAAIVPRVPSPQPQAAPQITSGMAAAMYGGYAPTSAPQTPQITSQMAASMYGGASPNSAPQAAVPPLPVARPEPLAPIPIAKPIIVSAAPKTTPKKAALGAPSAGGIYYDTPPSITNDQFNDRWAAVGAADPNSLDAPTVPAPKLPSATDTFNERLKNSQNPDDPWAATPKYFRPSYGLGMVGGMVGGGLAGPLGNLAGKILGKQIGQRLLTPTAIVPVVNGVQARNTPAGVTVYNSIGPNGVPMQTTATPGGRLYQTYSIGPSLSPMSVTVFGNSGNGVNPGSSSNMNYPTTAPGAGGVY